jgi:polyisoprenoid-binding protein YceI
LAEPQTYIIDSTHTLPRFSYNHLGYSNQMSRFNKTSGKIVIDQQAKTGSVVVSIDTTSVDTGYPLFNDHIQSEDFLSTSKYPTMTFISNKLKFISENLVAVDGLLTLKGISKPVELTVTSFLCMPNPILKKDACGANATAVIKRTDFNMGKYSPQVGDDVTITIPVEAIKE